MYTLTKTTGAQQYWAAGFTGKGVDVAVIDSGVVPVDGLATDGKIVYGPDLSFESQSPDLTNLDTFGHGTHMAGIIAGRASAATPGTYTGDTTNFLGMAPDSRIVSLKVADAHGATDVSQVIAAIDWVVQHRQHNGLNIRVLNLSYGTDSTNDYRSDPLAFAVEQAWQAGIFVVAAAGNAGFVDMARQSLVGQHLGRRRVGLIRTVRAGSGRSDLALAGRSASRGAASLPPAPAPAARRPPPAARERNRSGTAYPNGVRRLFCPVDPPPGSRRGRETGAPS